MSKILISGGAGFIGSRLCEKLFAKGHDITVMDNLSSQIHGNGDSYLYNKIKKKCTFIKGDVRNKNDWQKAIYGQDIIVHLAAETGTTQSMYELDLYREVNIKGTSNMLDVILESKHDVQKIIVASSRAIYGEGKYYSKKHGFVYPLKRREEDLVKKDFNVKCPFSNINVESVPTDEDSKPNPLSIYASTKHKQEDMVMFFGKSLSIPTVALRYQNVYGPGQSLCNPYTGILSIFSTRILNGNDIEVYEDGQESRDFVYIEDAVWATIAAIERSDANGHIFNVGSGIGTSVIDVAKLLKTVYSSDINILINKKFRVGDIRHNYADLKKISYVLGYTPKYSFQQGVLEFVKWVKTQKIAKDMYESSVIELKKRGLIK